MGTGTSRSNSGRRGALLGFLIFVTSGPASAENFALFSDLLSVAGRAGSNYHQNRLEARVRALEDGIARQAHGDAQRSPDPEVIADAERDLGLILSTPMSGEQRRRLLVSGMTRAKYNDPSLAGSPRFQELRRNAIRYYLEHYASPQLRELSAATGRDAGDPEVFRLYADTYLSELRSVNADPTRNFPPMPAAELAQFRGRIEAIRSPSAPAAIIDHLRAGHALGATPEQIAQLQRVMDLRRDLDRQYPVPAAMARAPGAGAEAPLSPLLQAQRSLAETPAIRDALAASRSVDISTASPYAQGETRRVLQHAVLRGNRPVVEGIAEQARLHRESWWNWDKLLPGGGALGGLTLGSALGYAIMRSSHDGLPPMRGLQLVKGTLIVGAVVGVVGAIAGSIVNELAGEETNRDTRLTRGAQRAGSNLGGWDLRPVSAPPAPDVTPTAVPTATTSTPEPDSTAILDGEDLRRTE